MTLCAPNRALRVHHFSKKHIFRMAIFAFIFRSCREKRARYVPLWRLWWTACVRGAMWTEYSWSDSNNTKRIDKHDAKSGKKIHTNGNRGDSGRGKSHVWMHFVCDTPRVWNMRAICVIARCFIHTHSPYIATCILFAVRRLGRENKYLKSQFNMYFRNEYF